MSRFGFRFFAFALAFGATTFFSKPAQASSYTLYDLGIANNRTSYGITTDGTAVVVGPPCSNTSIACYDTYVGGSLTAITTTPPALPYDNGTSCSFAVSGFSSGRCNGAYDAYATGTALYTGLAGSESLLYSGSTQALRLNSVGDLLFVATGNEEIYEAVQVTPEPSTLALLGTGALGLAGGLRRRILRR